jgi:hypothetical protein
MPFPMFNARTPMWHNDLITQSAWKLLEEIYLDEASQQAASSYAGLSVSARRAILVEFTHFKAITSKRWAAILRDLPVGRQD